MGDFRLEDLWAIIQGLFIVTCLLFGCMALIALWPKIKQCGLSFWYRYVAFQWHGYLADTAHKGVRSFRIIALENRARRALRDYVETAPEPEPRCSLATPDMNAIEPPVRGSLNPDELALNADELAAVQKMIYHKLTVARPSKSSTIQAGFGVSRGGSQLYQRASLIYDALFGQPDPAVETPIARRRTHARFHG